ncbi:hypothetical protein TNCT_444861 [Trichonephila clavata]|uniref:Uncharacterized protein n=1 Tax=Trichonephila clavata TaxID=2740835 RepID=A0A8X6EXL7_TRICU|nr:hypothetical protein TNCT_444861 [Trichonephila clavata]
MLVRSFNPLVDWPLGLGDSVSLAAVRVWLGVSILFIGWVSGESRFTPEKSSSRSAGEKTMVGITDFVPSIQPNLKIKRFNDINRSILADPSFDKPGKIDMIIGAELFYQILKDGRKAFKSGPSSISLPVSCRNSLEVTDKALDANAIRRSEPSGYTCDRTQPIPTGDASLA